MFPADKKACVSEEKRANSNSKEFDVLEKGCVMFPNFLTCVSRDVS